MEVMYNRKTGDRLEVFGFDVDHSVALYYSPALAATNGGNGWQKIQCKLLIPEAYADKSNGSFMSKTERNDVKSHLKLVDAVWQCTDGLCYTHKAIDEAIEHQRQLMKEDK